jgi:hypothetical protein
MCAVLCSTPIHAATRSGELRQVCLAVQQYPSRIDEQESELVGESTSIAFEPPVQLVAGGFSLSILLMHDCLCSLNCCFLGTIFPGVHSPPHGRMVRVRNFGFAASYSKHVTRHITTINGQQVVADGMRGVLSLPGCCQV